MNILGFGAFAVGFAFIMWTLTKLMSEQHNERSS